MVVHKINKTEENLDVNDVAVAPSHQDPRNFHLLGLIGQGKGYTLPNVILVLEMKSLPLH